MGDVACLSRWVKKNRNMTRKEVHFSHVISFVWGPVGQNVSPFNFNEVALPGFVRQQDECELSSAEGFGVADGQFKGHITIEVE
jgi:hypothetical protein